VWKPIKVGALLAGTDPVAVDAIGARMMCYVPERIPTIVQAAKNGLGTMDNIDILGEKVENLCKYFQPSRNWINIVDLGSRKVWPNAFLLYLRKVANDTAFKLKINRLIEKFHR